MNLPLPTILNSIEDAILCLDESRKTHAIGSLAGGIALDFNSVLAAVISEIDLVLHLPECPAALKEHLLHAQTSARRGAELVDKLQAFSRQSKPAFSLVDLSELIEQVAFVLRRCVDPKVSIHAPLSPNKPWPVKADSEQLVHVLLNLGINARDAMPEGGRITIAAGNKTFPLAEAHPPRRVGDFVRLTVTDTGSGVTPEVLRKVFEPHFATKGLNPGLGLSLSIASAVVAEHSGWMEAEPQAGKGTAYSVFLPRGMESTVGLKPIPLSAIRTAGGKERILVVDDEEMVRYVTKAVLAYRGYQITEAEDGEDAVKKYSRSPALFDLVLMDLHMPRMNGHDALIRIREINPKAKVILLSGGVHDPAEGIGQMDKVAFLHKPFENQALVGLVRKMLDSD